MGFNSGFKGLSFGTLPYSPAPTITILKRGKVYVDSVRSFSVLSSPRCLDNFCGNSMRACRQITRSDEPRTGLAEATVLVISGVNGSPQVPNFSKDQYPAQRERT